MCSNYVFRCIEMYITIHILMIYIYIYVLSCEGLLAVEEAAKVVRFFHIFPTPKTWADGIFDSS